MGEYLDHELGVFVGYSADAIEQADAVYALQPDFQRVLSDKLRAGLASRYTTVKAWRWDCDADGAPVGEDAIAPCVEHSEFAVFVLRGRMGPGTRHEIEQCRQRGTRMCVAFPADAPPNMTESGAVRDWLELLEYKQDLSNSEGFLAEGSTSPMPVRDYADADDLAELVRDLFERALPSILREAGASIPPQPPATVDAFEPYRAWLRTRHDTIALRGLGRDDVRLPLDEVFVPLRMAGGFGPRDAMRGKMPDGMLERGESRTLKVEEVFAATTESQPHVAVFGKPGAGKTTALKKLLLTALERPVDLGVWSDAPLPVLVALRHFGEQDAAGSFADFVGRSLNRESSGDLDADVGARLWERGNLVLLLDGLDEVADEKLRGLLCGFLAGEVETAGQRGIRVVLSCRTAIRGSVELGAKFAAVEVQPLSADECEQLVRRWFHTAARHMPEYPRGELMKIADGLIAALSDREYANRQLLAVVSAPLMLTLLCVVALREGEMPKNRVAFYEQCLEVLLRRWRHAKDGAEPPLAVEHALAVLRRIAELLHFAERQDDLRANEFVKQASRVLRECDARANPVRVLHWLEREAGLFDQWVPGQYRFMHLGLQEFLCAQWVALDEGRVTELARHAGEGHWREVTLLAVGLRDRGAFKPWCRALLGRGDWLEHTDLLRDALRDAASPDLDPLLAVLEPGRDAAQQRAVLQLLQNRDEARVFEAARRLAQHGEGDVRTVASAIVARDHRSAIAAAGKTRELLVAFAAPDREVAEQLERGLLARGVGAFCDTEWWSVDHLGALFETVREVVVVVDAEDPWSDRDMADALDSLIDHGCAFVVAASRTDVARAGLTCVALDSQAVFGCLREPVPEPVLDRPVLDKPVRVRSVSAGDERIEIELPNGEWVALLSVPGGEFEMGGGGESWNNDFSKPVHRVCVSPFWLASTPVTNRQYAAFMAALDRAEPSYWRDERFSADDQPVVGVSWEDAMAYCEWFAELRDWGEGHRVGLPSEAQWEFAARGTDGRPYPWGREDPDESRACFGRDWSSGRPDVVAAYPAGRGPFGHDDLAGLVWEWCADGWDAKAYKRRAKRNRVVVDPCEPVKRASERALRGGGWNDGAQCLRSAARDWGDPDGRGSDVGFRVAVTPPSTLAP